jgi:PAS domain S-box-containing protein
VSKPLGIDSRLLEESAEELYEEAPCGYLSTSPDGLIVKVNRTFLDWTGYEADDLVGSKRLTDLLTGGGRIYHETHYAPLLRMQGWVREIAIDIKRADGSVLPALVNSVLRLNEAGVPQVVRTMIFDATDRRLYERQLLEARRQEQRIADELQRSLLAGEIPSGPGHEIEIVYEPASEGLDVGGDWYDAFWVNGDDRIALVVGDVVGRGITAAATMGQLRSAVRALAATDLRPGPLLTALDRFSRRHDIGMGTTLVYAELDLSDRSLRWACGGHPPPLLARDGSDPTFLWEGRSAPLDAYVGDVPIRDEGSVQLEPGDFVLMYTDGLVERRATPIAVGMDRLAEVVTMRRDDPGASMVPHVFRLLQDDDHSDDTCLLGLRVSA